MTSVKSHKESASSKKRSPSAPELQAARRSLRTIVLLTTAGLVVVAVAVALMFSFRPAPQAPAPAGVTAAASTSNPGLSALDKAADAVGFRQTTAPNVGVVETLPADTTLLPGAPSLLSVGTPAPAFSLLSPTGERVSLSDFKGRTVLLEFFATWCPHCQAETPHLVRLFSGLPKEHFAFVSINADSEDAASIYAFHRWFALPWLALLDPGPRKGNFSQAGSAGPVTEAFGVALYPTFYIIDPSGHVAWRGDREKPDSLLLRELTRAAEK